MLQMFKTENKEQRIISSKQQLSIREVVLNGFFRVCLQHQISLDKYEFSADCKCAYHWRPYHLYHSLCQPMLSNDPHNDDDNNRNQEGCKLHVFLCFAQEFFMFVRFTGLFVLSAASNGLFLCFVEDGVNTFQQTTFQFISSNLQIADTNLIPGQGLI